MKAAGMVPLTLNADDMKALVSYVSSLGGATADTVTAPPATGSASPAPEKAEATATAAPAMNELESKGEVSFKAHRCAECHGGNGVAGTAAAPGFSGKGLTPAAITTMLQHPIARMQQGGMPPISVGGDELKALAAYVSYISSSKSNPKAAVSPLRGAGANDSTAKSQVASSSK
jgi:mono/diheme cytochrome c family protein